MTNAFIQASKVETEAMMELIPYINSLTTNEQIVMTSGQMFVQKVYGDFICRFRRDGFATVELKSEAEDRTGNMFLEAWSNYPMLTPGWMHSCRAQLLWYYFLASRDLYTMKFRELYDWAITSWNVGKYPMKEQKKHSQHNVTCGWCVPIQDIQAALRSFEHIIVPEWGTNIDY